MYFSYFVGGNIEEDNGFAIKPWFKIRFSENKIVISRDNAIAMGNYYFTSVEDKKNETNFKLPLLNFLEKNQS